MTFQHIACTQTAYWCGRFSCGNYILQPNYRVTQLFTGHFLKTPFIEQLLNTNNQAYSYLYAVLDQGERDVSQCSPFC